MPLVRPRPLAQGHPTFSLFTAVTGSTYSF
jgi:hypothetical protein